MLSSYTIWMQARALRGRATGRLIAAAVSALLRWGLLPWRILRARRELSVLVAMSDRQLEGSLPRIKKGKDIVMKNPVALLAAQAAARAKPSNYPPVLARRVEGRTKRPLGDVFGLKTFGVNLTTLAPGASSALQHRHDKQDEFVYVLAGEAVLVTGDLETPLHAGMCAGFPSGGVSHHIENRSDEPVHILEVGDRTPADSVSYPHDDLAAFWAEGAWQFRHKDGTPY